MPDYPHDERQPLSDAAIGLAIAVIREQLASMTNPDDRLSLFAKIEEGYCRTCGGADGFRCVCMRDE